MDLFTLKRKKSNEVYLNGHPIANSLKMRRKRRREYAFWGIDLSLYDPKTMSVSWNHMGEL